MTKRKEPDWDFWLIQDAWSLREGIMLILNIDPDTDNPSARPGGGEYLPQHYSTIERTALRSHKDKKLKTINETPLHISQQTQTFRVRKGGRPIYGEFGITSMERTPTTFSSEDRIIDLEQEANLRPLEFIQWAADKNFSGVELPQKMISFSKESSKGEALHDISPEGMKAITDFDPGKRNDSLLLAEQITTHYLREYTNLEGREISHIIHPDKDFPGKNGATKNEQNRRARIGGELIALIFSKSPKAD